MRFKILLLIVMTLACCQCIGQKSGVKVNYVMKLISIECEDFCFLEMVDVKTGKKYGHEFFDKAIDEKTQNWSMMTDNSYNQMKLNGKRFNVEMEYRSPQYYGDKKPRANQKLWMVNRFTRL